MNRPIFAGKAGASTTGPLGAFTSLSLNFPIWKQGHAHSRCSVRVSWWCSSRPPTQVVVGHQCESKQEKVLEIYKELNKTSFFLLWVPPGSSVK